MNKTKVIYFNFLCDVACQTLLKSANVSPSYSKNNIGTVFLRQGNITNIHQLSKETSCIIITSLLKSQLDGENLRRSFYASAPLKDIAKMF